VSRGRTDEPALAEVLLALAEAGPLEGPAQRLGLTTDRLTAYLRESASSLAWVGPNRKPAVSPSAPPPAPVAAPRPADEPPAFVPPPLRAPSAPSPAPSPAPPTGGTYPVLEIFSDGAARGNPGPAGAGAVVRTRDGKIVARLGKFLGTQTNNVAEYEGVLIGLEKAIALGAREVHVFADSLLVINQLRGEWKIKHPGLKPLYVRAKALLAKFDRVSLKHVPREQNGPADEMSNRAIDERM